MVGTYVDVQKLLERDQRKDWWVGYGQASGEGYTGLPKELARDDLHDVTAQPLLNYLVALSYRRKRIDFGKLANLNELYADLLTTVYERAYEKRPVSDAARGCLEQMEDDKWLTRLSVDYPSRRVFRFWQPGGGFDPNVFREKTVPAVIDYIHANPVRRGLVAQPIHWERSSARFWEAWPNVPLRRDDPFA